jgi:hypothetical protein
MRIRAVLRIQRLMGFGEFSIDIEIFANVRTTNWTDFLAIAEDNYE